MTKLDGAARGAGGLVCRTAGPEDLPAVLELFAGAVERMRSQGIDQWDELYPDRETLREDIEKRQMILLTENGAPVSAVVVNGEQVPEYGEVPWSIRGEGGPAVLHRLCVAAPAQGRGFGRRTLLAAEKAAASLGFRYIRLDAFPKNPRAVRLYESSGYRLAGRITIRKGLFHCYEKKICGGPGGGTAPFFPSEDMGGYKPK